MSCTNDWFEEHILIKWNDILEKQEYIENLLPKIQLKNLTDNSTPSSSIYKEVLSNLDGCYNCLIAVIKLLKYSVESSKTKDEESTDNKIEDHASFSECDASLNSVPRTFSESVNEVAHESDPQVEVVDSLQKLDLDRSNCLFSSINLTDLVKNEALSFGYENSVKGNNYGLGPELEILTLSSTVKISVSHVASPYCFWVQLTDICESNLKQLANDISDHISSGNCRRINKPIVGMKCLAPYSDGCFYRAKILNITKSDEEDSNASIKTNVLYVDYGNTDDLSSVILQEMPHSLSQLSRQAICCSLANIVPVDNINDWQANVTDIFQKLVSYSDLLCIPKISCTDGFPHLVHLYPINFPSVSSLQLYSISLQLISKNCAIYIPIYEQVNLICKILKTWVLFSQQPLVETSEASVPVNVHKNYNFTARQQHIDESTAPRQVGSMFTKESSCSTIYEHSEELAEEEYLTVDKCELSFTETRPEKCKDEICLEMSKSQTEPEKYNSTASPKKSLISNSSTLSCDDKDNLLEGGSSEQLLKENKKVYEILFSNVSTPSDFYIHLINSETIERLADLVQTLNEQFLNLTPTELLERAQSFKIEINSLCCCYDKTDQSYHRGIIIDFRSSQKPSKVSVKVFYIDYGYIAWILRKHIYPLNNTYKKFPALAVHCALARICPVGQKPHSGDTYIWPEKTKKAFKKNINLKDFYIMEVLSGNLPSTSFSLSEYFRPPLQVIIAAWNDGEAEMTSGTGICINSELVRLNHATLTEKSAETELMNWDPMKVDYTSRRNQYKMNIDDAQIATQGFIVDDEKKICKFYREGRKCRLGSRCPYQHIRLPDDCFTVDKREAVCKDGSFSEFELPIVGSLVGVEVSAIINPAHFYLILPWGKDSIKDLQDMPDCQDKGETLADLQRDLQEFYKLSLPKPEENLFWGIGELVAARAVVDQDWYRGRICEVNDVIDMVKVFFIDFGNVQWVPEENIQPLDVQFTHLPHQSVECCLNGIVSASEDGLWIQEVKDYFLELVDDKVLVASIKAIISRRMYIDLYDTYQTPEKNIAEELISAGVAKRNLLAVQNSSNTTNSTTSKNYIPG